MARCNTQSIFCGICAALVFTGLMYLISQKGVIDTGLGSSNYGIHTGVPNSIAEVLVNTNEEEGMLDYLQTNVLNLENAGNEINLRHKNKHDKHYKHKEDRKKEAPHKKRNMTKKATVVVNETRVEKAGQSNETCPLKEERIKPSKTNTSSISSVPISNENKNITESTLENAVGRAIDEIRKQNQKDMSDNTQINETMPNLSNKALNASKPIIGEPDSAVLGRPNISQKHNSQSKDELLEFFTVPKEKSIQKIQEQSEPLKGDITTSPTKKVLSLLLSSVIMAMIIYIGYEIQIKKKLIPYESSNADYYSLFENNEESDDDTHPRCN